MDYTYRLSPAAQEEYESSVSWYLKRSLKAATSFVDAIDKALENICNHPKMYRNEYKDYYEFNVQKYPYTIIYVIEESLQKIIVIAIYHQKRQPRDRYR